MDDLNESDLNTAMAKLCRAFEQAVVEAKRYRDSRTTEKPSAFGRNEIDWFSRKSYNIVLEYCFKVDPVFLTQMTACSSELITLLLAEPSETAEEIRQIKLRRVNCEFISVCAFAILGRNEDRIDLSRQHYLSVRKAASSCRAQVAELLESLSPATSHEDERNDFAGRFSECIKYEIEAAMQLEAWSDLGGLFDACLAHSHDGKWAILADLAIAACERLGRDSDVAAREHAHPILAFLEQLIRKTWSSTRNVPALCRWTRCLYQLALRNDERLALRCVEQARRVAAARKDAPPGQEGSRFPPLELEWLATTAFNRGVDLYCAHDEPGARLWAEQAIMLAGCAADGGRLLACLQKAFAAWTWDAA